MIFCLVVLAGAIFLPSLQWWVMKPPSVMQYHLTPGSVGGINNWSWRVTPPARIPQGSQERYQKDERHKHTRTSFTLLVVYLTHTQPTWEKGGVSLRCQIALHLSSTLETWTATCPLLRSNCASFRSSVALLMLSRYWNLATALFFKTT